MWASLSAKSSQLNSHTTRSWISISCLNRSSICETSCHLSFLVHCSLLATKPSTIKNPPATKSDKILQRFSKSFRKSSCETYTNDFTSPPPPPPHAYDVRRSSSECESSPSHSMTRRLLKKEDSLSEEFIPEDGPFDSDDEILTNKKKKKMSKFARGCLCYSSKSSKRKPDRDRETIL